mmetsp:Transcript_16760/g.34537  ORF Transcript_16760/g.34537 Transcript_16760/m.34537 type:complete len:413 (-) Transcript_16760:2450-3688(-)
MKVRGSIAVIIGSASAAILGYQCQIVGAFKTNVIRRVPYEAKQCNDRRVHLSSPPYTDYIESSIALTRVGTTRPNTLLFMSNGSDESPNSSPAINIPLITRNLANQALLGSTIWTGGNGLTILTEETRFGTGALVLGVLGVIPLVALSRAIETSESPLVSGLNLSTNMAVLRLFGPTSQPILAFFASLLMAASTGLVEETLFRGQSLPFFAVTYGNGDVWVGVFLSTLLFAVLHTNPLAFFKGKEAFVDNSALLLLQMINGGIFALLYLFTGNLVVPIISHTLYDLYIFYKTHLVDVAGQMEYAKEEALMPICSSNRIEEKYVTKYGEEWLKEMKESFYLMDTNRDGELSRKELRIALYSYGINLSKLESEEIKEAADIDGSGYIDFDEYLEFVGPNGSSTKAVRNTLLGPT